MCNHLGESGKLCAGDTGSAHTRRPSGCIPGCLIPVHVHAATRNHLHGGHSSWCPSTPWGPQLGTQVSMTRLFAQVIPGLASLSGLSPVTTPIDTQTSQPAAPTEQVQYTAIPLEGSTIVSTGLFPGKQVRCNSMAV